MSDKFPLTGKLGITKCSLQRKRDTTDQLLNLLRKPHMFSTGYCPPTEASMGLPHRSLAEAPRRHLNPN